MDVWNPAQYHRFQNERSQPFWDLAALADYSNVKRMLDIGCGSGELTAALHTQRKIPYTLGFDSSARMLEKAPNAAGLEFKRATVESFSPGEPFDFIISNAVLQWIDDHAALIPRILGWLKPGGQLAVQVPVNFDHPSHSLAEEMGVAHGLKSRNPPVLPMEDYARLLDAHGAREVQVFVKVYLHHMKSSREVAEWTKGTLLTHFEKQMNAEDFQKFVAEYTRELISRLGEGAYLYTFKRLFFHCRA